MNISLIVAIDQNYGIGKNGTIPWSIKIDTNFFQDVTKRHKNSIVIMGANTWKSINSPLKDRTNIIISSTVKTEDAIVVKSFDESIQKCRELKANQVFICGGSKVYKEALRKLKLDKVYITKINKYGKISYELRSHLELHNFSFLMEKRFKKSLLMITQRFDLGHPLKLRLVSNSLPAYPVTCFT